MHMRGLAIAILALGSSAAHADSFTTYNLVNVVVTDRNFSTVTGTLTFDTTSDVFTSAQITQTGEPLFAGAPTSQGFNSTGQYDVYYQNTIPATVQSVAFNEFVSLLLPGLPVGNGINLCSVTNSCGGNNSTVGSFSTDPEHGFSGFAFANSGQLTPAVATTPEPSSIALLATGLLGGIGVLRKRIRNPNS